MKPNQELQRLASVFLDAYRPLDTVTPKETWDAIQPFLKQLKNTLPDDEAQQFHDLLKNLVFTPPSS